MADSPCMCVTLHSDTEHRVSVFSFFFFPKSKTPVLFHSRCDMCLFGWSDAERSRSPCVRLLLSRPGCVVLVIFAQSAWQTSNDGENGVSPPLKTSHSTASRLGNLPLFRLSFSIYFSLTLCLSLSLHISLLPSFPFSDWTTALNTVQPRHTRGWNAMLTVFFFFLSSQRWDK